VKFLALVPLPVLLWRLAALSVEFYSRWK
jgi:hypothetical protein